MNFFSLFKNIKKSYRSLGLYSESSWKTIKKFLRRNQTHYRFQSLHQQQQSADFIFCTRMFRSRNDKINILIVRSCRYTSHYRKNINFRNKYHWIRLSCHTDKCNRYNLLTSNMNQIERWDSPHSQAGTWLVYYTKKAACSADRLFRMQMQCNLVEKRVHQAVCDFIIQQENERFGISSRLMKHARFFNFEASVNF